MGGITTRRTRSTGIPRMIGQIKTIAGRRIHIGRNRLHIHIDKPFYAAYKWFKFDPEWVGIGISVAALEEAENQKKKLQLSWYTRKPTYTLTPFRFRKLAEKWGGTYKVHKTNLLVVPSGKLIGYKDKVWVEELDKPEYQTNDNKTYSNSRQRLAEMARNL